MFEIIRTWVENFDSKSKKVTSIKRIQEKSYLGILALNVYKNVSLFTYFLSNKENEKISFMC